MTAKTETRGSVFAERALACAEEGGLPPESEVEKKRSYEPGTARGMLKAQRQ